MKLRKANFINVIIVLFFVVSAVWAKGDLKKDLSRPSPRPFKTGDALFISTMPDTTSFLNGVFPIDGGGQVEFPIIGKVQVSAMTVKELENFLKQQFKDYLHYPNIYIKPLVRISLLGGFAKPGLYYVDINSSLWQAVNLAGGTLLENGIYEMHWERNHKKKSDDITPFFERGISLKNMGFQSGDQLWTPSPTARTFWDAVRDVMPILTFTTSLWMLYNTYQRDTILLSR